VQAIRIIKDEHRAVGAVLHGMGYMLREIRQRGVEPRFDVLGAMVYYLDIFSERLHHPRESEYLFRFLRLRCKAAVPFLDQLEEEHHAGAGCLRAMKQALARYQQAGSAEFAAFEAVVESFVNFEYEHMRREERHVLPMAEHHLLPEDWEVIDAAYTNGTVPSFSPQTAANFENLFDRIVQLAPSPIGVGPPSDPLARS